MLTGEGGDSQIVILKPHHSQLQPIKRIGLPQAITERMNGSTDWTALLQEALTECDYLPERCLEHWQALLSSSSTQELALDGTERRRQRPRDYEEPQKYYRGKKTAHTVKNDLVVEIASGYIKYLSQTVEGNKPDNKILDEESLGFLSHSSLYQDSGFQGYEPEGTLTYQPQKKPRGR